MKNIWNFERIPAVILLLLLVSGLSAQDRLNMHLDHSRFLSGDQDTILLLDYQIPYRSIVFLAQNGAYFAQVDVKVQISNRDSLLFEQSVTDNIGIRSKHDAMSYQKAYLNRMSFQLPPQQYNVDFYAKDPNSSKEFRWSFALESLSPNARISDVELNSKVVADSSSYLEKFQRNGMVYEPRPSIILNREYNEYAYLYFELYTPEAELGKPQLLSLYLEQDGQGVMDEYIDTIPQKTSEGFSIKIPLQDLKAGKFEGSLSLLVGEELVVRDFFFVLSEEVEAMLNLFPGLEDEFQLMRYFMASNAPSNWDSMADEDKRRHVTNFWKSMAASTGMAEQKIIDLVSERVNYSNKYYSSLKPGWTTDRGRVYIRNGAPADIERGTSSDEGRFVRKDYEIWKYSSGNRAVYIFMDIQMNNNFRLIYADGDDMEISNPDWLRYLGSDFDTSLLRN